MQRVFVRSSPLRRFAGDRRAVAAVEFALILPLLLLLYFGSIEGSTLYGVDRRINVVAGTMGDLVSRSNGTLPAADLNSYFLAAEAIMRPYSSSALKQVVSVLTVASDGTARVRWSRGFNGGTAHAANSTYSLSTAPQIRKLAKGGDLVVSEMSYDYVPVFSIVIPGILNLNDRQFYMPRFPVPILPPS